MIDASAGAVTVVPRGARAADRTSSAVVRASSTSSPHPPLFTEQPLSRTHLVSPEPLYPDGHALHSRPPSMFVQSVIGHIRRYSWRTRRCHHTPCPPVYPGQAPRASPMVLVHATSGEHPPLTSAGSVHSSTSSQPVPATIPSPSNPAGHAPQITGGSRDGSGVHFTSGWHPLVVIQALIVLVGDELIGGSRFEIIDLVDVLFDVGLSERL